MDGFGQSLGDDWGHFCFCGVVAQEFFHRGKFARGGLLRSVVGKLFLLPRAMFGFVFHTASGGLGKVRGKSFSRTMQFATHGIGCLFGERGDFVITHLFIGNEQQEEAIFFRDRSQRSLDALAKLFGFESAERRIGRRGSSVPDRVVLRGDEIPAVPALLEVLAMIDGDAIQPGADG